MLKPLVGSERLALKTTEQGSTSFVPNDEDSREFIVTESQQQNINSALLNKTAVYSIKQH